MILKYFVRANSFIVVILSCVLAVSIRQFSNVINEPIIHEFDPHFNWRCTQYIDKHGLYEFLGWFDNISWYPQGRPVGETSYPGLMYTSAIIKWTLQKVHINISLLSICVNMGSFASVLSVLITFLIGELMSGRQVGIILSSLTSFVPGMIARSIGGSYDYECISLFIILFCVYTFSLALKKGSLLMSIVSGFGYGYLALSWGGYVFISNCIPLYAIGLMFFGFYSWRLHISYSIWAIVGTLLTAQIPFIYEKIFTKPEHFGVIGAFGMIQIWGFFVFLQKYMDSKTFNTCLAISILILPVLVLLIITIGMSTGLLGGFSGRLMNMFDPSYASKKIPIIASVAEHQPTAWIKYYMDCALFLFFFPVGIYNVLRDMTEPKMLVALYGLSTLYFASIMVRLVIVFTPAMVLVSGLGIHTLLVNALRKKARNHGLSQVQVSATFVICVYGLLHSVSLACFSYSGDHIHFPVFTPRGHESADDYREAYRWLWSNTYRDDIVMSWWDYGYQITSMGNRACIADGNTNNFTHIGIIGMTMSSPEQVSWRLARLMDVNYMLVIFGGASGYTGDDINKFLWMPRIANQTFTNISGDMYIHGHRSSVVGRDMTVNMSSSMIFKFCYNNYKYYRPHQLYPLGYDVARKTEVPNIQHVSFHLFEESYTTKNWVVRIYKVKPDPLWNRVY